jgi:plastocyanin
VQKKKCALGLLVAGIAATFVVGAWRTVPVVADEDQRITIRDDCDPTDPGWDPTGGCALSHGDVNLAEFNGELDSPLAAAVIGHQAWRNDPSYLKVETGDAVRVRNRGGRVHTFTEVKDFGGGRVPPLNEGLIMAKECETATNIVPGAGVRLSGLSAGNHRFQCCIHPWMRAIVKVKSED